MFAMLEQLEIRTKLVERRKDLATQRHVDHMPFAGILDAFVRPDIKETSTRDVSMWVYLLNWIIYWFRGMVMNFLIFMCRLMNVINLLEEQGLVEVGIFSSYAKI